MARPLRIEFPGAVYHVMARGNQGQRICADDQDRKMWLATVDEACRRTGWRIHAWALMSNHYHVLLETPEANLVNGMKWLQGTYTQRFNSRHQQRGHLFQGRYRAVPVEAGAEAEDYFQVVSTYIHLNPARAKRIRIGEQKLWEYPWSSYPQYVRGKPAAWLVTERVLGSVGLGPEDRRGYEVYLETRALEWGTAVGRREWEAAWQDLRRGWYMGGPDFQQTLLARIKTAIQGRRRASHGGLARHAHDEAEAERLLAEGLSALGLRPTELVSLPKGQVEKQVLAWWLCERTTVTRRWVAKKLAMGHESRVAQALHAVPRATARTVRAMQNQLRKISG